MIRIGLILFPGSNCERETALAVKRAGMEPVEVLWNEASEALATLDGYVIIGGFSYEDRSRAGIIAALQPMMNVIRQQSAEGKPVLGICNGAQILVESGLITDLSRPKHIMALAQNKRIQNERILGTGFYNQWVHMRVCDRPAVNAFTRHMHAKECMHLPVAHAEGRFTMSQDLYHQLERNGLNLFQYCNAEGEIKDNFPVNPNGSIGNLAAVINEAGNVMAMMPHPERTANGDTLFTSMREYIAEGERLLPASHNDRQADEERLELFKPAHTSQHYLIRQVITDNQAMTVQKTLQQLGFPVQVKRFVHWEVDCASEQALKTVLDSGVLYCDRKEICLEPEAVVDKHCPAYLVADKEDVKGREAAQTLTRFYGVTSLKKLQRRTLWQFSSTTVDIHALMPQILATHIIGNPYAHDCYEFNH